MRENRARTECADFVQKLCRNCCLFPHCSGLEQSAKSAYAVEMYGDLARPTGVEPVASRLEVSRKPAQMLMSHPFCASFVQEYSQGLFFRRDQKQS